MKDRNQRKTRLAPLAKGSLQGLYAFVTWLLIARAPFLVAQNFTRVTEGEIVAEGGQSVGCAWGDYNNDGSVDLFVARFSGQPNVLYRNNGNGTFTKITAGEIVNDELSSNGCAWGDYDNDGFLDLFVTNEANQANFLYRNNGDGTFTPITEGGIVNDNGTFEGCAWADYNNDGLLDLFAANKGSDRPHGFLYRNNGNGRFTTVTEGALFADGLQSFGCSWADYDNDGDLDLFVAISNGDNVLYRNNGDGTFNKVTEGAVVADGGTSTGCAWGDYDNDGDLDLFVVNFSNGNFLYQNNGDGTFKKITQGAIVEDSGNFTSAAWADYDNDGHLDLFLTETFGNNNLLYHNNGDGTFTKITEGDIIHDTGASPREGCAWADYNNDGFLDLFIARFGSDSLYRNDGNSNNWINIKCVGIQSNRAAIGTKVRVKATIGGKSFWQMREISGGGGYDSQNDLRVHFGLGDATRIDVVRIEWPSGIAQELTDIVVKQFLTLIESRPTSRPVLGLLSRLTDGRLQWKLTGDVGKSYAIQASTGLVVWTPIGQVTVTNADRTASFTDQDAGSFNLRFYRAVSQ